MNQQFFGNTRLAIQRAQQLHQFFTQSVIYDQFKYIAKMPQYPKIILLKNNSYNIQQLMVQLIQQNNALLFGYPNTVVEVEKYMKILNSLDRLLDRINLAIKFKLLNSILVYHSLYLYIQDIKIMYKFQCQQSRKYALESNQAKIDQINEENLLYESQEFFKKIRQFSIDIYQSMIF